MADDKKLTAKEEAFCQTYLIDFNGARAARDSGYSPDSAKEIAAENLTKPHIRARIEEIRKEMGKQFNITRERIAQEYARIAFFDIRKIYDGEELKPMDQISDDEACAIGGVKRSVTTFGDGDNTGEKVAVEVKVWDKRAALDSLVKLMGYAAPTKTSFTDPDGNAVTPIQLILPAGE